MPAIAILDRIELLNVFYGCIPCNINVCDEILKVHYWEKQQPSNSKNIDGSVTSDLSRCVPTSASMNRRAHCMHVVSQCAFYAGVCGGRVMCGTWATPRWPRPACRSCGAGAPSCGASSCPSWSGPPSAGARSRPPGSLSRPRRSRRWSAGWSSRSSSWPWKIEKNGWAFVEVKLL